jgi:hypothetical protein
MGLLARMVTDKIAQLKALHAQAAELQRSIIEEQTRELSVLPGRYGFDSVDSFIDALKAAVAKTKKSARKASAAKAPAAGKRTRTKITPELKADVKAAVEAGKTGATIATEFGISLPSVQNIKKEFGLVKTRASDAAPAAEPAPDAAPAPEASS